jgi:hypothetical protein
VPQQAISFNGLTLFLPGVYYGDNVSASLPTTPPATPPLVFIAYAWGPKPKVPTTYITTANLASAMRGSPGSLYIPALANPSPNQNGAQFITLIDPSQNTQSSQSLLTTGSTAQTILTSTLYGPPSNQLTSQVTSGSVAGLKLTVTDNFAGTQLVGDNLTVPFQLAYSGAASGVTYSVTSATFTIASSIPTENVIVPIGPGQYSTTALLTEYLNGTGNYFAEGLSATGGQLPSNFLTAITGTTLVAPVSGNPQFVNVNAYLHDIAFWVNQFAAGLCTAVTSGADTIANLPVTGSPTFFSGARGVPPTNNDYALALNAALNTAGWVVFCDSNTPAVQALLAQHCEIASSTPYGAWRRGFTGSSIGDTVTTTITNATGLDSLQMNYLYPGIYVTNTQTGQNQLQSGLYAAAAAAGIAAGNQIALPLTNKVLNGAGVELANAGTPLSTSQLAQLQNGGVQVLYLPQSTGVPTILSDVTTWQVDDNIENTSSQQIACRYWLAYSLVNTLLPYIGTIAAPITEMTIIKAVIKTLNALIYTGGSSNGVLASWGTDENGNSVPITLMFNGEQQLAGIQLTAELVSQNKYITVYSTLLPLSFTISSTTAT